MFWTFLISILALIHTINKCLVPKCSQVIMSHVYSLSQVGYTFIIRQKDKKTYLREVIYFSSIGCSGLIAKKKKYLPASIDVSRLGSLLIGCDLPSTQNCNSCKMRQVFLFFFFSHQFLFSNCRTSIMTRQTRSSRRSN